MFRSYVSYVLVYQWHILIFWLVVEPTPLKNMSQKRDHDIPNWMEIHKIPWFQTTKQMGKILLKYINLQEELK